LENAVDVEKMTSHIAAVFLTIAAVLGVTTPRRPRTLVWAIATTTSA